LKRNGLLGESALEAMRTQGHFHRGAKTQRPPNLEKLAAVCYLIAYRIIILNTILHHSEGNSMKVITAAEPPRHRVKSPSNLRREPQASTRSWRPISN
jgi:hypothetical protein